MRECLRRVGLGAGAALALFTAADVQAAGLYVTDRGVRPMGRGGAFVAGADDLNAIYYNPAGVREAGNAILVDATYVNYSAEYTRRTQAVDGSGIARVYEYPKVSSTTPFLRSPPSRSATSSAAASPARSACSAPTPQSRASRIP